METSNEAFVSPYLFLQVCGTFLKDVAGDRMNGETQQDARQFLENLVAHLVNEGQLEDPSVETYPEQKLWGKVEAKVRTSVHCEDMEDKVKANHHRSHATTATTQAKQKRHSAAYWLNWIPPRNRPHSRHVLSIGSKARCLRISLAWLAV